MRPHRPHHHSLHPPHIPRYFCPEGNTAPAECGAADVYCPPGAKAPIPVDSNFFSAPVAVNATIRYNQLPCSDGNRCTGGVQQECDAGTYCKAGVVESCTNVATYCLAGSSEPTAVSEGFYTFPEGNEPSGLPFPRVEQKACTPGYSCQGGMRQPCGSQDKFSPGGLKNCIDVQPGYFTTPAEGLTTVRTDQLVCERGNYCVGGTMFPCPAGTYGSVPELKTVACSGQCNTGVTCPVGSTSQVKCTAGFYCTSALKGCSAELPCGGVESYCPEGSGDPVPVTLGYYTTPENPLLETKRVDQERCPEGFYCSNGRKRPCGSPALYSTAGATNCTTVSSGFYSNRLSTVAVPSTLGGVDATGFFQTGQVVCDPGFYCSGGTRHAAPKGSYISTSGVASKGAATPCPGERQSQCHIVSRHSM